MKDVIAVDASTPKRQRLTDYFAKLPSNTEAQEFPQCLMSALVQDNKRLSDTRLSHYPVDLTRREDIWRALVRAIAPDRAGVFWRTFDLEISSNVKFMS